MKRIASATVLTAIAVGAGSTPALAHERPATQRASAPAVAATSVKGSGAAQTAVAAALTQVGGRYVWGGTGNGGFDCSGLMQWAYKKAGINLPRTSAAQKSAGVRVSLANLKVGDLIHYRGHVAMYIGGGKQVAAANAKSGIKVQNVYRGALFATRVA